MCPLNYSKLISFLDLTSLNDYDTKESIIQLCQQAKTPFGEVAAVCVLPNFVELAASLLQDSNIKVATVSNFPTGTQSLPATLTQIEQAIKDGADEIDLVMPYSAYFCGEIQYTLNFIASCKSVCDQRTLKVILETGALKESEIIAAASHDVIEAGADFIKTSTGKYLIGATPRAAEIMLKAIQSSEYNVGFKAAGGIRTVDQANVYLTLAETIMGPQWLSPVVFRIGASQLLKEICALANICYS